MHIQIFIHESVNIILKNHYMSNISKILGVHAHLSKCWRGTLSKKGWNPRINAKLDISARGFWNSCEKKYFDIRMIHPTSQSYSDMSLSRNYQYHKKDKDWNNQRVIDIEKLSHNRLVFATSGGWHQKTGWKDTWKVQEASDICHKLHWNKAHISTVKTNPCCNSRLSWQTQSCWPSRSHWRFKSTLPRTIFLESWVVTKCANTIMNVCWVGCTQGCSAKKEVWEGVPTACVIGVPTPIKRKTAPNSSNKVSIRLQEFPHWIFLLHCRLLTNSAKLCVASTSVRSQPCFNVIVWIPHLQVTLLVQKRFGNAFPPHYTPLCTSWQWEWSVFIFITIYSHTKACKRSHGEWSIFVAISCAN